MHDVKLTPANEALCASCRLKEAVLRVLVLLCWLLLLFGSSSCSLAYDAWGAAYHHAGGYGKEYKGAPRVIK